MSAPGPAPADAPSPRLSTRIGRGPSTGTRGTAPRARRDDYFRAEARPPGGPRPPRRGGTGTGTGLPAPAGTPTPPGPSRPPRPRPARARLRAAAARGCPRADAAPPADALAGPLAAEWTSPRPAR